MHPGISFKERFKSALPVALLVFVWFAMVDSYSVMRTTALFFPSALDKFFYVVFAAGVYLIAGAVAAVGLAILPLSIFAANKNSDRSRLAAFYLSIIIGLGAGFLVIIESVTFFYFYLNPLKDALKIAATVVSSYLLIRLLTWMFSKSASLSRAIQAAAIFFVRKSLLIGLAVLFVVSCFQVFHLRPARQIAADGRPNIILISFDTLAARHMSAYGYPQNTTPNLDQLAKEGALFQNHYSVSRTTLTSHMSILTSTYPGVHKVIDSYESVLDDRFITLAEILKEEGYENAAFVDGTRELNIGAAHGFDSGFDFYGHYQERLTKFERLYLVKRLLNFVETLLHRYGIPDMHTEKIFASATDWLRQRRGHRPFFLFLHTYDIHSDFGTTLPYVAPKAFRKHIYHDYRGSFNGCGESGKCATDYLVEINVKLRKGKAQPEELLSVEDVKYIASLYDAGIEYADYQFGRFMQNLKKLGALENTIIVATSDHGEEFFQHSQMKHTQYYDEILQVPLILYFPKKLSPGAQISQLTRSIDILPTILELADIERNSEQFQGRSLLEYVGGQTNGKEAYLFGGEDRPVDIDTRFLRTTSHKIILNGADRRDYEFNFHKPFELYDLKTDPDERHNIALTDTATFSQMLAQIEGWVRECSQLRHKLIPTENENKLTLDEKTRETLKSLGYLK